MHWTDILDLKADLWATEFGRHWWISSACRATREEQQDLARAGREGRHVAERQSPWPMWVYLAPFFGNTIDRGRHSLWMLRARLPNHPHMCNVALTASASQSLLWAILQVWKSQEAKVALGSSVLDLVYGAATSKKHQKKRFGATFCSIPHWWMILKGFCTLLPKNWEAFGKYPCNAQQCPDAQCTMFRAASARTKLPHVPLIPQLGCDLTLVIQPATRVEKPQQFHPWETAVITWDRWVHPYVFAFFLKLVIREGVTYFQLTASKALLQESSLHVRTFSRSEVLLGMGRVEEGVVLPSECMPHALRKHSHKPGGTGTLLRWLHQVFYIRISPNQPFLYIFLYLDFLV